MVRFGCSQPNLRTRRGILGMSIGKGETASKVLEGTTAILREFCTVNAHVPRQLRDKPALACHEDTSLYNHIRQKSSFL